MDDTARKASGGVRNLRAMFENRDNSEEPTPSPQPNRGRSGAPDSGKSIVLPYYIYPLCSTAMHSPSEVAVVVVP